MKNQNFGIEIEMTGISRDVAADVVANYFHTVSRYVGGSYSAYEVKDSESRTWKLVFDSSIRAYNGNRSTSNSDYKVELVSPICQYKDIEDIQQIVRNLRTTGAKVNNSCGIHIHIDASKHNARTLRNITNIMYSKEDLIYKALDVEVDREYRYAKKVEEDFIQKLNRRKPQSVEALKSLWYNGNTYRSNRHYDDSRYHALNLHSVFSKGTIEFRLFNGTLHAGKIKSYIQFCLAISNQALTQTKASRIKTHSSNEKYTFRTWLLRLGLIGPEYKTARGHLLNNLEGCIAWKDPNQAVAQRERIKASKHESVQQQPESSVSPETSEQTSQDVREINIDFSVNQTM